MFDDVKHFFERKFFETRLIFLINLIREIRTTFFFRNDFYFFFHFRRLKMKVLFALEC